MTFYRKIKLFITFECRSTDLQDAEGNDRIVVDQSEPIPVPIPPIEFRSKEEAHRLTGDLETWANSFAETLADEYANKRCPGPTVYASDWEGIVDSVEEWEEIPVPQDVIDRIERLEGLILDSQNTIKEYEDMIADILAIREEDRTEEDKAKLLRLDGYIRAEKENIRKFEFEINRLKKEWNIE